MYVCMYIYIYIAGPLVRGSHLSNTTSLTLVSSKVANHAANSISRITQVMP